MDENPYGAPQAFSIGEALVPRWLIAMVVVLGCVLAPTFLPIWWATNNEGDDWYTTLWKAYAANYNVSRTI